MFSIICISSVVTSTSLFKFYTCEADARFTFLSQGLMTIEKGMIHSEMVGGSEQRTNRLDPPNVD